MELKPCPFCGKESADLLKNDRDFYFVECGFCDARTTYASEESLAVFDWNRRASGWIPVGERLPEVVRGVSYQTWTTGPVLVIHSDRPDYPITAHMLACKGEPEAAGMAIRPICQSEFDWVWWYPHPGCDLRNPFGLKDQDYDRYSSSRFGHCITHWQPLPEPPV